MKGKPLKFSQSLHSLLNPHPKPSNTQFNHPQNHYKDGHALFNKNKSTQLSFHSYIQSSVEKQNFSHQAQTTITDFRKLTLKKKHSPSPIRARLQLSSHHTTPSSTPSSIPNQHPKYQTLSQPNQQIIQGLSSSLQQLKNTLIKEYANGSKTRSAVIQQMQAKSKQVVDQELGRRGKRRRRWGGQEKEGQGGGQVDVKVGMEGMRNNIVVEEDKQGLKESMHEDPLSDSSTSNASSAFQDYHLFNTKTQQQQQQQSKSPLSLSTKAYFS